MLICTREDNGFEYRPIGITQSSYSTPLQNSIIKLFNILGFKVSRSGTTIYLCGKEQIKKYLEEISFSNPKHLKRFKEFLKDFGWVKVSQKIVLNLPLEYNPPVQVSVG